MLVDLLLSGIAIFRLPDALATGVSVSIAVMAVSPIFATLALGIHAVSPFLSASLPWRFAISLLHVAYYAIWKVSVSWKARPQAWVRTTREPMGSLPHPQVADPRTGLAHRQVNPRTVSGASKPSLARSIHPGQGGHSALPE